jgi:uncharacterized protein YlxP (DUF503 family)
VVVGTLELQLRLDGSFSLKDKRRVLRSLMDRSRRDFHVSIAEVGDQDLWNCALLGVSCVSNEVAHAEAILQSVIDLADSMPEVEIVDALKHIERR